MVMRILSVALSAVLFLIVGSPLVNGSRNHPARDPTPFPAWRDEVVAPGVNFNLLGTPSLALDPGGFPHIVYGQNSLFHAWFDGVLWHSEVVDSTQAYRRRSVLAIDESGTIIIADTRDEQMFLHSLAPGGSWQASTVPLPGSWHLSLALDSGGWPHIVAGPVYRQNELAVLYARQIPTGWMTEMIGGDNPISGPLAIDIDSNDRAVILYQQHDQQSELDELWIARRSSDSWQHDQISTGCEINGKSLVLDAQDMAYAVFSDDCDSKLTYARERNIGWETKVVTENGIYPSLALDSAERPNVAYGSDLGQVYAILTGTGWDGVVIQTSEYASLFNTLVLDNAGAAHVASLRTDLQYATNSGGQWQVTTTAARETVGWRNALALDSADTPHALYHKAETQELYWGSGNAENWQAELVTGVSPTNLELAIAVDGQDMPHIAYIESGENKLVVGMRQAGQWLQEPIAAGGKQLSLATGSDNRPQLILFQNDMLVYWTKQAGVWVSEAVAGPDSGIWNARLALDSQDRPHVAYTGSSGSIHTFRQSAGNWAAETLPFETIEGLAFGPGDKPYLLFSESTWVNPKYPFLNVVLSLAESTVGGWHVESFWDEEYLDWYDAYWDGRARLAIDANSRVHVSILTAEYLWFEYEQRDEDGWWRYESPAWSVYGDIDMALGEDGEPRVLTHDGSSLILSTREIEWLDKFSFVPIMAR